MSKVDLSIIIISYNTRKITEDCLLSVIKFTKRVNYEIIVVDNGSLDGSVAMLKKLSKKYSKIKVIDAKKNLGFGAGNNLGVENSRGKYLLFLNSDTLIYDDAISVSLNTIIKHPSVGAFSCRLTNLDGTFQTSGGYFPSLWNVFCWQTFLDDLPLLRSIIPSFHPHHSQYKKQALDWVTGAFMMVNRDFFKNVGGFDEKIFMYTEEMELCYRLNRNGHRTLYINHPAIIHLGGASGGSYLALTSEIKNMIYFWQKHKPKWQIPIVKFTFLIGSLLRLIIFGIIRGNETSKRAYADVLGFLL